MKSIITYFCKNEHTTIDFGDKHPTWVEFLTQMGYSKSQGVWIVFESVGGMRPDESDKVLPHIEFYGIRQGGYRNGFEDFSVVFV